MLITSGILMNIPQDMYESARIDGAGPVRQFFSITLPYMLSVTTPYLITQFIGNLNNFNLIYLLTGGGPLSLNYYQAG
ncbi:ABC transporter permease subunit [Erysipelothrix sp. D19-032]